MITLFGLNVCLANIYLGKDPFTAMILLKKKFDGERGWGIRKTDEERGTSFAPWFCKLLYWSCVLLFHLAATKIHEREPTLLILYIVLHSGICRSSKSYAFVCPSNL